MMAPLPHYADRLYESARQRRKYRSDPDYRLKLINKTRARKGLSPHNSLDDARLTLR